MISKLTTLLCSLALVFGCSGATAPDELETEATDAGEVRPIYIENGEIVYGTYEEAREMMKATTGQSDFGSLKQALVFPPAGAIQPGIAPDTEEICNQVNTTQNCVIPSFSATTKRLRFYIAGGAPAQNTHVKNLVVSWWNDMVALGLETDSPDDWSFSETTNINDPQMTLYIDVVTSSGGFCTAPGNRTRNLSCFTGATTGITPSGIVGTYHRWTGVPILHVDLGEVDLNSLLTTTQKTRRKKQGVYSGLTRFTGKGLAVYGDHRCGDSYVVDTQACSLRVSDACWASRSGDAGNLSSVWVGGANCGTL